MCELRGCRDFCPFCSLPGQDRALSRCSNTAWMNETRRVPPPEALRWLPLVHIFATDAWCSFWRAPRVPSFFTRPRSSSRWLVPQEEAPGQERAWFPGGCGEMAGLRAPGPPLTRPLPCPVGQRVHADQDSGRLLLLRVGLARVPAHPRPELCEDGAGHVRGH